MSKNRMSKNKNRRKNTKKENNAHSGEPIFIGGLYMRNKRLINKMKSVLGDEELSSAQIIERLKEQGYNKRGYSFTSLQVSVILSKNRNFERINNTDQLAIWRNRNVMDRKIQAE